MRKILLMFSLFFCLFPSLTFAAQFTHVYRLDYVDPQTVFSAGFTAQGINRNFELHVTGWTSGPTSNAYAFGSEDSAFISTTSNYLHGVDLAIHTAIAGEYIYLYDIRPTEDFYSDVTTMNHIASAQHVTLSPNLIATLSHARSYVTLALIPGSLIRGAHAFYRDLSDGAVVYMGYTPNRNYVDADTHTNEGPYMGSDNYPLQGAPVLMWRGSNGANSFNVDVTYPGSYCPILPPLMALGIPPVYAASE